MRQTLRGDRSLKTHTGAQDVRVLSVVSDDDESVGDSQRIPQGDTNRTDERLCCLGEHLFAQLAGATALDAVQFGVDPTSVPLVLRAQERDVILHLLIRAVDSDVEF